MTKPFAFKYIFHWCGPCMEYDDTKEETIIRSDGMVLIRIYDHHEKNGHYRLVKRAKGTANVKSIEELYINLLGIITSHEEYHMPVMDAEEEIILSEPGLKIIADASLYDGANTCGSLIKEFLDPLNVQLELIH